MAERQLVVNADDFGQSSGINRGVIETHERGIVTSASLMVRWSAAAEAASYGRRRPGLSLGLHVDLGEWACRNGAWRALYAVVPLNDAAAIETELAGQLAQFRDLVGADPTHLDSHQHVHRHEPARSRLAALAGELGVPLRGLDHRVRYTGEFYGQTATGEAFPNPITVAGLLRLLEELPRGVTELGCHPGYAEDVDTMYRGEREREVATLCDPAVRAALGDRGIELVSFAGLRRAPTPR